MSLRSVLVAGATGTQGGAVTNHLLERDVEVYALTRNPESNAAHELAERGATVVAGDMSEQNSLASLIEDVDGVFCVTTFAQGGVEGEVEQGTTMAEAAADIGVEQFVFSSVGGAERDSGVPHFESKFEIEHRIEELGLPATIVRPTYFMRNFEGMREQITDGTLALPLDEGVSLQMVDPDDIGALVAEAFDNPDRYVGEKIELAGDERTLEGMAGVFSDVVGTDVEAEHVPIEVTRESMGEEFATMFEWFNENGYEADIDALRREYGIDLASLETYLREHEWEQ